MKRAMLVLPAELVVEILKRLPVKFLYRCMSVCRLWHSVITSNHFVSTHLNYQKALSNGNIEPKAYYPFYYDRVNQTLKFYVFCDDGLTFRQLYEFDCPNYSTSSASLVGHRDGIICLYNCTTGRKWFTLWNPSQKKYIEVDFHHECEVLCLGFGVDAYHNDYKLVALLVESRGDGIKGRSYACYVYSLRAGYWRHKNVPYSPIWIHCSGTHLEGVIHWGMMIGTDTSDPVSPFSMLTFNLADETFNQITLPKVFNSRSIVTPKPMTIKWHGKDCLSHRHMDVTRAWIHVWVMEKYGIVESWREVAKHRRSDNIRKFRKFHDVRMNGEIVLNVGDKLVSMDPKTEKCEVISSQRLYHGGTYVESLVSLELVREAVEETK